MKIKSRLARISIARDARAISSRTPPIRAISRIDKWLARIQILSGTAVRALPGRIASTPRQKKTEIVGQRRANRPATVNLMYPVVAVNATGITAMMTDTEAEVTNAGHGEGRHSKAKEVPLS